MDKWGEKEAFFLWFRLNTRCSSSPPLLHSNGRILWLQEQPQLLCGTALVLLVLSCLTLPCRVVAPCWPQHYHPWNDLIVPQPPPSSSSPHAAAKRTHSTSLHGGRCAPAAAHCPTPAGKEKGAEARDSYQDHTKNRPSTRAMRGLLGWEHAKSRLLTQNLGPHCHLVANAPWNEGNSQNKGGKVQTLRAKFAGAASVSGRVTGSRPGSAPLQRCLDMNWHRRTDRQHRSTQGCGHTPGAQPRAQQCLYACTCVQGFIGCFQICSSSQSSAASVQIGLINRNKQQ